MNEKTRIRFNNIVVTAEELSKIEQAVRVLSSLAPSDAFLAIDFNAHDGGYRGIIKVSSSMTNFEESSIESNLVDLMSDLSTLIMVHIKLWKKHRFNPGEPVGVTN